MRQLNINNPYNAPVYHKEKTLSTMDISRELALTGEPNGTVISADYQKKGRGRKKDRSWKSKSRESLLFSIKLDYPHFSQVPSAITLRAGLALAQAIEDFYPVFKNLIKIKWPNDIMIPDSGSIFKKTAGILAEADNKNIHIGFGINIRQKKFPSYLKNKATSIALSSGASIKDEERFSLLEIVLEYLYKELNSKERNNDWRSRIEERLFRNGENAIFIEGAAGFEKTVKGIIKGIGQEGELLILPDGEDAVRAFACGEMVL